VARRQYLVLAATAARLIAVPSARRYSHRVTFHVPLETGAIIAASTPFRIEVPQADLDDPRDGLRKTRWPERETVDDWSQGVPLGYTQDVCRYWAEDYDWRDREARLRSGGASTVASATA
jgi:Epoxide hydrolase N terminus